MSYDNWKTTEPDRRPYEESGPIRYRCLDCTWKGLAADSVTHHRIAHHRIGIPHTNLIAQFSCCANKVETKGAA